jgi:prepilin-type N-terminal cleavage/methylation domain-containing protein
MEIDQTTVRRSAMSGGGFTLPEVLMAVGIATMMFASVYLAIAQGYAVARVTRENLRASQILEETMETLRLYSWDQINAGYVPATFSQYYCPDAGTGNQGVRYQGTVTRTDNPVSETYSSDMKLYVFTVTWTSGGIQRLRTMRTYVSKYGLQNYVYPAK